MHTSFVGSAPLAHLNSTSPRCGRHQVSFKLCTSPRRRQRHESPRCCDGVVSSTSPADGGGGGGSTNTRKMLVVDLQEILRPAGGGSGDAQQDYITDFSERVEVDRKNAKNSAFVLFNSSSGYEATVASLRDFSLVEPDALATLNGTELYQRRYRTPDPLWAKTLCQGWTPKPILWVAQQFFADDLTPTASSSSSDPGSEPSAESAGAGAAAADATSSPSEMLEVRFECKQGGAQLSDIVDGLEKKLEEMGISARVIVDDDLRSITVMPAAASAADVVGFCQMMLRIEESNTFVFGGDKLIEKCVGGKGNMGLASASSGHDWSAFEGRVYVSKDVGMQALLDGIMHHAVL